MFVLRECERQQVFPAGRDNKGLLTERDMQYYFQGIFGLRHEVEKGEQLVDKRGHRVSLQYVLYCSVTGTNTNSI